MVFVIVSALAYEAAAYITSVVLVFICAIRQILFADIASMILVFIRTVCQILSTDIASMILVAILTRQMRIITFLIHTADYGNLIGHCHIIPFDGNSVVANGRSIEILNSIAVSDHISGIRFQKKPRGIKLLILIIYGMIRKNRNRKRGALEIKDRRFRFIESPSVANIFVLQIAVCRAIDTIADGRRICSRKVYVFIGSTLAEVAVIFLLVSRCLRRTAAPLSIHRLKPMGRAACDNR